MDQPLQRLLHRLRTASPGGPDSDVELLDRFARLRDEGAFASLVARHGPMVRNVCRRLLGDAHAAEDAFQATFLVLARRAGSVARPDALAGWLYGVACRVALKARGGRRRHEGLADAPGPADLRPGPPAEASARDLLAVLEEEVRCLPEAYRMPVVLCCLEGLSQEEAARLGCTPGAVKGRLERGRKQLHRRLEKRGLSWAAAPGLAEAARLPGGLSASTAEAAVRFAAGQAGANGARAAALAEGVLRAMYLRRLTTVGVMLLALTMAGAAVGVMARQTKLATAVTAAPDTGKGDPGAGPAKVRKLRAERRHVLKKEVDARRQAFLAGRGPAGALLKASGGLLRAELDLTATAGQRVAAHAAHLKLAREVEGAVLAAHEAGQVTSADLYEARAARLAAEIGWLEAGGKEKDGKGRP